MAGQTAGAQASEAASQEAEVLYRPADHIATITLNRPERMNTISGADAAPADRAAAARPTPTATCGWWC